MDRCGREPTPTNVKKWVDGIGTELGIQLFYSERLHSALTCRYRPSSKIDESVLVHFEDMAKEWVVTFYTVYQQKRVTPYIHAMHSHVGQFIRRHGALLPFMQQGLEKYNDRVTRMYFR